MGLSMLYCWSEALRLSFIAQGAFSFGALIGFERSTVLQHPKYVYEKLQVRSKQHFSLSSTEVLSSGPCKLGTMLAYATCSILEIILDKLVLQKFMKIQR